MLQILPLAADFHDTAAQTAVDLLLQQAQSASASKKKLLLLAGVRCL
jgi:hypothetical protein